MSVTTPAAVKKFRDVERDFGTTDAQALWQRAAQIVNYVAASQPVGRIMVFHATQPGLPFTPDTRYWQLLDGSTVTNPLSPLFGVTLPDARNRLVRHPAFSESVGSTGGSDTVNLSHSHGGFTDYTDDREDFQMDNGDERREANVHRHSIGAGLSVLSIVPPYRALQLWVRIV